MKSQNRNLFFLAYSFLLLLLISISNVNAANTIDPCSESAKDTRRTIRIYDAALRDVVRQGADAAALTNLKSAFDVITAEHAGILFKCGEISNSIPVLIIDSPQNGAVYPSGSLINFSGSATDAEDGALTNVMVWTSSLSSDIGSGGSFAAVLPDGLHTITAEATDASGVIGSSSVSITINVQPSESIAISGVEPSISYSGIDLPVTITAQNPPPINYVGFAIGATVEFIDSAGMSYVLAGTFIDASSIVVTVPAGMPAGSYDIFITNPDGSFGTLYGGFLVTDDLSVSITDVIPSILQSTADSVVKIYAENPLPPGTNGFMPGASVLFSEVSTASPLHPIDVTFIDTSTLEALLGSGAFPGLYDVIVINPDGTSGLLPNAIEITPSLQY